MLNFTTSASGVADILAPLFFVLAWFGYMRFADRDQGPRNLTSVMHDYRRLWMRQMLRREQRIVDTSILGNLMRSMSFFASTTMFIIAGLVAVLGAKDEAMALPTPRPCSGISRFCC